jgi:hypothetical protein
MLRLFGQPFAAAEQQGDSSSNNNFKIEKLARNLADGSHRRIQAIGNHVPIVESRLYPVSDKHQNRAIHREIQTNSAGNALITFPPVQPK